jgi:hypothetical protein
MVLRKVNEMATLEILAGSAWADKRTFQMDVIYDLINGQRTISEIIDLSFVGEFETCKNLIAMMDAGMIEPAGINPLRDRRNGGHSQKTLKNAGAYLLLGGLSLALVFQLIGIRGKSFPLSVQEYEGWKTLRQPVEKLEGKKRENAAEVFLIEKNRYPHDQSELIQSGLIPRVPAKP